MRTVTDAETQKKAELQALIEAGADPEQIIAAAQEVAQAILEAAEAEAALKFQGHTWTPEQRAALSAKLKGRPGKPWTDEQRAKLASVWTPEKRAELSAKLTGRHLTDEQKAKLSNSLRANKQQREAAQTALQNRIAELEAMLAGTGVTAPEPTFEESSETETEAEPENRRGRRRNS
jgi:Spy/CpxP family protein refolding chaperone